MATLQNITTSLLLSALIICTIMQPGAAHASVDDEKSIEQLFETYGKSNVVKIISEKRGGQITIQKHSSFTDIHGRPNLTLITPKSILQDLGKLESNVSELSILLDRQQKQQAVQNEEDSKQGTTYGAQPHTVPLSAQLDQKIKATKYKYSNATSSSDRRRLKKELSILQSAYKRAKENEESKLRVYFPDEKKINTYKSVSSSCQRAKAQLQEITDPVFRHQVFFCSDRQYRKENPKSCEGYQYRRKYDLNEYKEEVVRRREQVSNSCKS